MSHLDKDFYVTVEINLVLVNRENLMSVLNFTRKSKQKESVHTVSKEPKIIRPYRKGFDARSLVIKILTIKRFYNYHLGILPKIPFNLKPL